MQKRTITLLLGKKFIKHTVVCFSENNPIQIVFDTPIDLDFLFLGAKNNNSLLWKLMTD